VARQYVGRVYVAVNRYDLEESIADSIAQWCSSEKVPVLAKIPFDPAVIDAVRNCRPLTEDETSPAAKAIQSLAARLDRELMGIGTER
jgi:MinD superfamily P-loop ATPase